MAADGLDDDPAFEPEGEVVTGSRDARGNPPRFGTPGRTEVCFKRCLKPRTLVAQPYVSKPTLEHLV